MSDVKKKGIEPEYLFVEIKDEKGKDWGKYKARRENYPVNNMVYYAFRNRRSEQKTVGIQVVIAEGKKK